MWKRWNRPIHWCLAAAAVVILVWFAAVSITKTRDRSHQSIRKSFLSGARHALQQYCQVNSTLPQRTTTSLAGQHHSWRALVLHQIGVSEKLVYRRDESWDSLENRSVVRQLAHSSQNYFAGDQNRSGTKASILALYGPGTAWDSDHASETEFWQDSAPLLISIPPSISDVEVLEPRDVHIHDISSIFDRATLAEEPIYVIAPNGQVTLVDQTFIRTYINRQ